MHDATEAGENTEATAPADPQRPTHYVGIGASAGGLEALEEFFTNVPSDSGLGFIVVQHLSPDHKSLMVELLSKKTRMTVRHAEDGMDVQPDHVYLIPPKTQLTIFHGKLLLKEQEPHQGLNLPIDIFLRSLAEDQRDRAVAVILSGTGSDGTRGVRAIKEADGMVMVQDEESARFDGMPKAAASTGVADFVLAPERMPEQLLAYVKYPSGVQSRKTQELLQNEDGLTRVLAELRDKTRVDFAYYKRSTISRRLERRMNVCQTGNIDDYVRFLRDHPSEVTTLYRELLIGVTNFFRDPGAMDELLQTHIPELLRSGPKRELRLWVAGCSTGEEAYTMAILAKEAMDRLGMKMDTKIFATDLDRDAIVTAGEGVYPESIAADLTPELLSKYFHRREDSFRITRAIREMVVFAQHNLVRDPPFTNIDLVSCRNLLIYLQPVLQRKALQMFNFSLREGGILFLGKSETVGEMENVFKPLSHRFKIYRSIGKIQPPRAELIMPGDSSTPPALRPKRNPASMGYRPQDDTWVINRFLDVLSEHYVPLAVIVNENMEIVHTLGEAGDYFKLPSGRAVYDISKMVVKELSVPVTTGIQKVFRTGKDLVLTNIPLKNDERARTIKLRITPVPEKGSREPLVAVFIETIKDEPTAESETEGSAYEVDEQTRERIRDLEQELQFSRENLQATIEELETANEELQATNEELLASNEELQSTNEELQSTNEELHTVNAEYQNRIDELTQLNNDVDNLLTGSRIGTMLLNKDLEIRRFSPEVANIFKILDKDVGRPITHIAHELMDLDPVQAIRSVQNDGRTVEQDVGTKDGKRYLMRILPYHIGPSDFSGVVVTFVDITQLRQTENTLAAARRTGHEIIHHMPAGLFLYGTNGEGELVLESGNPEAERLTGIRTEEWTGTPFKELWPNASRTGLSAKLRTVLRTGTAMSFDDFPYEDERVRGTYRIQAFRLPGDRLAVSFEDISERKRAERRLRESEERYRTLFQTMAQGVVYQAPDGEIISANPAAERILGLTLDQMRGRTSRDPRWRAVREDGSDLRGEDHPSMVSLRTGKSVFGFIMGVHNPAEDEVRWIIVNATPQFHDGDSSPYQVYTTFEDVTKRIRAEKELRSTNERLDVAFDTAGLTWWEWYPETGTVIADEKKPVTLGYGRERARATLDFWTSLIHPDDYDKAMAAMKAHLSGESETYTVRYRLRAKDGSFVLMEDHGKTIEKDQDGNPVRVLGTVRRIETDR